MTIAAGPRIDPDLTADERTTLTGFLDWHRETLAVKCAGLTPAQLAERAVPPSSMSLLGLVRHLADVERGWFQRGVAGRDAPPLYYSDTDPDGDFDNVDPATADPAAVEEAVAAWRTACAESRAIIAGLDSLDRTFEHPRLGAVSARWVLTHMLEEYCRHNGHADLLRERIDGSTGE